MGQALTVYDCEDDKVKFDLIDVTEPKPCPDPIKDYEPTQKINVQVIQTETTYPIEAHQCSVTRSLKVTKCGFNSLTYGSKWLSWMEQLPLTPKECRNMIENQEYPLDGILISVPIGSQVTKHSFVYGRVDSNGNCVVADFTVGGALFRGHYMESFITIYTKVVRGMVDASTGWVTFTNGLKARVSDEFLEDDTEGRMVWKNRKLDCKRQVSQVYKGEAELYQYRKYGSNSPFLKESLILIADNVTKQYAGLVLKEPQQVCQTRCYGTQIPGIMACPFNQDVVPIPEGHFISYFNPKEVNIQTQVSFLHLTSQLQTRARFEDIIADICLLDRKIMFNKVQAIAGVENPYALNDLYGPGHHIYKMGVTAYVAKCPPVEANRAEFPNCTQEIPVLVKGKLRFADPLTFVLKPFPTLVVCSAVMPIRWKIGGEWYCASPEVRPCRAPAQLNVTSGVQRQYASDMTAGLDGGIYTKEQLQEHRIFQLNHGSRDAVLSKLTTAATEYASGNGRLGLVLSNQDIIDLSSQLSWHIAPFVWMMGTAWHYLTGIGLLLMLLQFFCSTSVRAYTLYRHRGCGLWMFTALWDTAFYLITSPGRLLEATLKTLRQPAVEREPEVRVSLKEARAYQEMVDELASYLLRYRTGLSDVEKIHQEAERLTSKTDQNTAVLLPAPTLYPQAMGAHP